MAIRTLDRAHETSDTNGVNDYVLDGRANADELQFKEAAVEDGYTIGDGNDLFNAVASDGAQVEFFRGYIIDNGGPGSDEITRETVVWTFNGTTYDATSPTKISWSTGTRDVRSVHRGADVVDAANDGSEFNAAAFRTTLSLAHLAGANTWGGFQTAHTDLPVNDRHFATKKYVDDELASLPAGFPPSGTRMAFFSTTVISGWTRVNTWNDRVPMIASSGGLGAAGQTSGTWTPFSGVGVSVGSTSLTKAQLAVHDHEVHYRLRSDLQTGGGAEAVEYLEGGSPNVTDRDTESEGADATHTHSGSLTGTGSSWRPQYVTMMILEKD